MSVSVVDVVRKRGDTRRITFKVMDADKNVVDISSWTNFLLTVDPSKKPEDNTANAGQVSGALSTDGTDGRVHFSPAGTIPVGKYFYDCQALDSNSEKITFVEGKYEVVQDITKD